MTISKKPWAAKGVALYPPTFCMVGQNQVFNALHQFRRSFWDGSTNDMAGFFVTFGDWGLGKTRLGYEVIAEATGRVDEWLLNRNEHVIAPFHRDEVKARVLEPALKDGVLPLYVRYSAVCDEALDASSWVPRLTIVALQHMLDASPVAGGPSELYGDLQNALHAKGVELGALAVVRDESKNYDDRVKAVMEVLRPVGIRHLWVVVDEVETPADLKKGLREETQTPIDDEYLLMVSEVIKHENWRAQHPYVNFLLLCSMGMRDQIHIGPNLRRATSVTLEPNQVTDVQSYVNHIRTSLAEPSSVDYPAGTLEGAFLAANRNFGWLNVVMAAIHEAHLRHVEGGESPRAWELLREFAKTHGSAKHIFNDTAVLPLVGTVEGVPKKDVERLIYGQLPVPIGGMSPAAVTPGMSEALLKHEVAGRGNTFARLVQVHIDERGLANELTKPEVGFKPREGQTDTYYTPTCEISVVGLLEALRAFSVTIADGSGAETRDFVIYSNLEQWGEQLAALYPREGIEFAAEALHRIFTKPEYQVDGPGFVGMSFRLWREFNKLLVKEAETVRFFRDAQHEQKLEQYVQETSKSKQKRAAAVCQGLAKLLDEQATETRQAPGLSELPHQILTSEFVSPSLDGLRVTPDGRVTIVYCQEEQRTVERLKAFIGLESVHPILVLFPATADVTTFNELVDAAPALKRCIVTRRLVSQEEEFYLKYSSLGAAVERGATLSKYAYGLKGSYLQAWDELTRAWANDVRRSGYLVTPLWSRARGNNFAADFAKGYRFMVANAYSLDRTHKDVGGPLDDVEFENCKQGAKRNVDAPAGWRHGDLLGVLTTDGTNMPKVPRCFLALLQELRNQSSLAKLAKRFYFAVPDKEMKSVQQLEQLLELLVGVGVVQKTGDLYRAVDLNIIQARRQSASTWLKNECKAVIKDLEDLFPTQANILMNATYPAAGGKLSDADARIGKIDFGHLTAVDVSSLPDDAFQKLVKAIAEVEALIQSVCPLDIGEPSHQAFDCSPARIVAFETRFNDLSLWEKVSFLSWLKKTFLGARDEMIQEIDEVLQDALGLETAEGEPFPIAPATLPLKAIKSELENTVKGPVAGTQTRMATIKVAGYTLLIDQYLVESKFDSAWKRLDALRNLISKDRPQSFFARFKKLHDQWSKGVKDFKQAEAAWKELAAFVADAPATVVDKLGTLKNAVSKFGGLIRGGLKQQIQNQIDETDEAELIEALATEVDAAVGKLQGLEAQVREQEQALLIQLLKVIRGDDLRALNRVRKARNQAAKTEPSPAATYGKTKAAYEAFNGEVRAEGQGHFENAGKKTHWSLWVEICAALEAVNYVEDQHPDHSEAIRELKEMKLVQSKLELR